MISDLVDDFRMREDNSCSVTISKFESKTLGNGMRDELDCVPEAGGVQGTVDRAVAFFSIKRYWTCQEVQEQSMM
jgi:hypothetical protein